MRQGLVTPRTEQNENKALMQTGGRGPATSDVAEEGAGCQAAGQPLHPSGLWMENFPGERKGFSGLETVSYALQEAEVPPTVQIPQQSPVGISMVPRKVTRPPSRLPHFSASPVWLLSQADQGLVISAPDTG